jgi:hypothetical protein
MLPDFAMPIASQNLGANIRRVFSLTNGNKIYLELFLLLLQQSEIPSNDLMYRYFISLFFTLVSASVLG